MKPVEVVGFGDVWEQLSEQALPGGVAIWISDG